MFRIARDAVESLPLSQTLKQEEIYANKYDDLDYFAVNVEESIEQYYERLRLPLGAGLSSPEEFDCTVEACR